MFCKNCGKELEDNARFCAYCGSQINETEKNENDKNEKIDKILEDIDKETKNKSNKKRPKRAILLGIIVVIAIMLITNSGVDMRRVYNKVLKENSSYAKYLDIASDNSYIEIDTNPSNRDDYYSEVAWDLIRAVNKEFGFSESLESRMSHTRALDGKQSEKINGIDVTWTYHPNQGLEVQYSKSK